MWHKGWRKDEKTFVSCYTIALKSWDEFNANFALLYFSSYRSMKILHLYLKHVEKNNMAEYLRLLFTYLQQNLCNIKKQLTLVLKKICPLLFWVFQTNLNNAVNIFCTPPEWIRNIQMIQFFSTIKTWMRILHA